MLRREICIRGSTSPSLLSPSTVFRWGTGDGCSGEEYGEEEAVSWLTTVRHRGTLAALPSGAGLSTWQQRTGTELTGWGSGEP